MATVDIGPGQFPGYCVIRSNASLTTDGPEHRFMGNVQNPDHSDGAPTIEGTGIRVKDIAVVYEHNGYEPEEITRLYPDLSLGDVHRALASYDDSIEDFRSAESALV